MFKEIDKTMAIFRRVSLSCGQEACKIGVTGLVPEWDFHYALIYTDLFGQFFIKFRGNAAERSFQKMHNRRLKVIVTFFYKLDQIILVKKG